MPLVKRISNLKCFIEEQEALGLEFEALERYKKELQELEQENIKDLESRRDSIYIK